MVPFSFAGDEMLLVSGRAVFWPREQALLVADLHLEKASFFASIGQPLPPYDSRETLERLALALRQCGARRVFALGDNFHDGNGARRLDRFAGGMLAALTRVVDWVWIAGNHDDARVGPGEAAAPPGGTLLGELVVGGVALRHEARPGARGSEISGHFHPRLQLTLRGRRIVRPCVVLGGVCGPVPGAVSGAAGGARMILPAFGALTAGMDAGDTAIVAAMQPAHAIDAVVPAAGRLLTFPLWRAVA